MDVVRRLADRVIVLHNGALVADGEPAAVVASPIVQEAYLGVRVSSPSEQKKKVAPTRKKKGAKRTRPQS
jgi:branched-chain amino acid transport system ATP-binding protein